CTAARVTDNVDRTPYRLFAVTGEEYTIKPAHKPDNSPENEKEDGKRDYNKNMTHAKIPSGEG
ncbi:MAG: hypothetical protein KAQ85_04305, partial [Thermodesulfovibrionia bacterium]|nr:hypothetical protein [Thermodesulfovibrionia bacterium]